MGTVCNNGNVIVLHTTFATLIIESVDSISRDGPDMPYI